MCSVSCVWLSGAQTLPTARCIHRELLQQLPWTRMPMEAQLVPRIFLTAGSPTSPLTPDWNDVRYVTATLVDDAGTRAPESTTLMHFATVGPASIVAVDSGDFTDHDPYQATQRKVYFGNAITMVRAIGTSGRITVTAAADGIPSARVALTAAPIDKEDHNISMSELSARSF